MTSRVIEPVWQEVDQFVEAFELAWSADADSQIREFLPASDHPLFHTTLLELVRVDVELRWRHRCPKSLDDYRCDFPELFVQAESLNQIAFEDFRARRQSGEPVEPQEYAQRYGIATDNWHAVPATSMESHSNFGESGATATGISNASEAVPSGDSAFPQVGKEFLNFSLQSELGRGTFSRVYLARQGDLANRLVVLKVSEESFAEADKLARLQHENIVPIYSVHRAGQMSAVCMPYFGSATLADVVRTIHGMGSLPPSGRAIVETLTGCSQQTDVDRERSAGRPLACDVGGKADVVLTEVADRPDTIDSRYEGGLDTLSGLSYVDAVLWIGARLADGLRHAHERGILHRDLKPANVLMADDGRPMLLDFNLSSEISPTRNGSEMVMGGTLPYMAPEQILAFQYRVQRVDPRTDLFSLGIILFELLTGKNPFPIRQGSLEQTLSAMHFDRLQAPPRLRSLNPLTSPAVEAIILRCLRPDPAQRYQSAAELHEDLERQLKQLPLRYTREPSLRERAQKWTRRHSRLTSIVSILLFILSISFAVAAHQEHNRFHAVELEIARLMEAGQEALEEGDAEVAHARFLAAWMKLQAEPALTSRQPGVAGWLDHSRRATIMQQWNQRVHPREFDERRDEALLLSMLLELPLDDSLRIARDAIGVAVEMTIPGDPGWTHERELLTLVEADLIFLESNAEQSLEHLDATNEFSSRLFHERRAVLLERLHRNSEAVAAKKIAEQFPPHQTDGRFLSGISRIRQREFDLARQDFEWILDAQPNSFTARLFQAICFLNVNRPGEAKVALTSCLAQRPHFLWSYLYRSQANIVLGDNDAALVDLKRVLEMNLSGPIERSAARLKRKLAETTRLVEYQNEK